jgi:hypothetical protein
MRHHVPEPGLPEGVLTVSNKEFVQTLAERFPKNTEATSPGMRQMVPPVAGAN